MSIAKTRLEAKNLLFPSLTCEILHGATMRLFATIMTYRRQRRGGWRTTPALVIVHPDYIVCHGQTSAAATLHARRFNRDALDHLRALSEQRPALAGPVLYILLFILRE